MRPWVLRALLAGAAAIYIAYNTVLLARLLLMPGNGLDFTLIRLAYNFNTLWFPPLALLAGALALGSCARHVRPGVRQSRAPAALGWIFIAAGVLLAATRVYATHIEPNRLLVRRERIDLADARGGATAAGPARPIRVLHLSDIQGSRFGRHERRALEQAIALRPDLVLFTGDLMQPRPPATWAGVLREMEPYWRRLDPPLGKFAVGGDIDEGAWPALARGYGGFRYLEGESVAIALPGGGRLRLLGLPVWVSRGNEAPAAPLVEPWLAATEPGDLTILIGHAPGYILEPAVRDAPIDLCLAGHTHGGQIRLPWFGPITVQSPVPRELGRGFHRVGRTRLNVSAGIGCERTADCPPIRVLCPPEMTLFEIDRL